MLSHDLSSYDMSNAHLMFSHNVTVIHLLLQHAVNKHLFGKAYLKCSETNNIKPSYLYEKLLHLQMYCLR